MVARQRMTGPSFGKASINPVSRQMPSRCGPSHCGQSSARAQGRISATQMVKNNTTANAEDRRFNTQCPQKDQRRQVPWVVPENSIQTVRFYQYTRSEGTVCSLAGL